MFTLMEEVLVVLRNFEQENQILHEYVVHLQTNQASTSLGCISTTKPQQKKPWISLFDKFDGTCSKFRGFVNQVCLIIQLHPHRIQLAQPKLDSLTPYYQAWPLLGSHLYWNINHLYSMTSKCFLKSLMPPLEILTKNAHLTSKYNLFVKDHVQLQYMH